MLREFARAYLALGFGDNGGLAGKGKSAFQLGLFGLHWKFEIKLYFVLVNSKQITQLHPMHKTPDSEVRSDKAAGSETHRKSAHTPGPWVVKTFVNEDESVSAIISSEALYYPELPAHDMSPKLGTLAECYAVRNTRTCSEEVAANARLIAQAPAMLEVLARMVQKEQNMARFNPGDMHAMANVLLDAVSEARALLAAVEGSR